MAKPYARGRLFLALVKERLLLFLGQTVVAALAYLVEDAVNLLLRGLLTGVVVPVGVMVLPTVVVALPTVIPSMPSSN